MVDAHLEAERRRKRSMNGGSNIRGGTKSHCKRETGLTYPTIRKWWDTIPEGHITVKIRPSQALSDLLVENFKKGL